MDNMERDNQIQKTLHLINFVDFSEDTNHELILIHYNSLNWENKKDINDIEEIKKHIWYAILNYLYTGCWGVYSILTEQAKKAFGIAVLKEKVKNTDIETNGSVLSTKIDFEIEIEKEEKKLQTYISSYWKAVFDAHSKYIDNLKKIQYINSIIVYEAPPFPKDEKLNYILLDDAKGPYLTVFKNTFGEGVISDVLVNKNALFFDLLMLPIPLSSTIRRDWSTKNEFNIKGKQLPVVLFEMNLKYYLEKLNRSKLSDNIKIAIGTPHLTALGIYNYYCESGKTILDNYQNITESLTNCNEKADKKKLENYVVPLFKSCFVNASNNPDENLLKHALGLNE